METTKKEKDGWLIVAEKSLKNFWDNKEDDEIWSKYLSSRKINKRRS